MCANVRENLCQSSLDDSLITQSVLIVGNCDCIVEEVMIQDEEMIDLVGF